MLENAAATSCQNPNFERMRLSFSWPADEICRPLPTARGSASEKRLQAASPDKEFEIMETGEEDGEEEEEEKKKKKKEEEEEARESSASELYS